MKYSEEPDLTPPLSEVLRYMGCRKAEAGDELLRKVDLCLQKLREAVTPRHLLREYEIARDAKGTLFIAGMKIRSKALIRNLQGCGSCYLLAATLGLGPDRLIRRSQAGHITEGVIYQAASAAMIEEYLNRICRDSARDLKAEGRYLRPRFSPGYGDFSLEYQKDMFQIL